MKKIDPAELEILRNYFNSIVTNMGNVIERTAFSTYVRESADFATALASPKGEFYAYPTSVGVTIFLGLSLKKALNAVGPLSKGDVVITNDPYTSDGLATHLVDVNIFKPIFFGSKLVSYAWTFVNVSDVGGSIPSSLSPSLTSIFQEGFRIPPMKLYKKGKINSDVLNLINANTRTPKLNDGDLDSMVSAVNTGEKSLQDAIGKFGLQTVSQGMSDLMDQSENRTSQIFQKIPDGTYSFADYIGDDFESNVPIRLAVDTTINHGKIYLDFSKCDPQVKTAFNLMTNGKKNSFLLQGLINFVISQDPYIPINGGIMRPISVNMPKGTMINPKFPAPVGIRHAIAMRMYNVILGSLMKAGVKKIPAAGAGEAAIVVLHNDSVSSSLKNKTAVVEPIGGGGGATSVGDGIDGIDHASGFLKNTPIEILEQNMDILIHQYQYLDNTAGVGHFRGGNSILLQFEIIEPTALITARGLERLKFQPWGVFGGNPGVVSKVFVKNKNGQKRIPKISALAVKKGDIVTIVSPSGGGFGNPLSRDVNLVLEDTQNQLLSPKKAADFYGVKIKENNYHFQIDKPDTKILRKQRKTKKQTTGMWEFGDYRNNYEKLWTPQDSTYLTLQLRKRVPAELIPNIKQRIHQKLSKQKVVTIADINSFLDYNGF